jgi:putative colanic acid biosynthesis acetyltransferase WcaF
MKLSSYLSKLDRGAPRWKEAAWVVCKTLFFLCRLPLPSAFRAGVLRLFGARIGRGLIIRSGVNIVFPWRLIIGEHVWIGEEVLILNLAQVEIGSHTCISQRAFLCAASHNFRDDNFGLKLAPISVGSECWIAAQAFLGPGTSIGNGSMVCAAAMVTGEVPPQSVARGNPATVKSLRCVKQ